MHTLSPQGDIACLPERLDAEGILSLALAAGMQPLRVMFTTEPSRSARASTREMLDCERAGAGVELVTV